MKKDRGVPKGRLSRSAAVGGTAMRMGGGYLAYAAKRPFMSGEEREKARRELAGSNAEVLFDGLCRLKGTALKMAQLLSLELDMFPVEVRDRLERSCNEVPPMNRALVRRALMSAYGRPPEEVFRSFDNDAFAAASLGQVHRAVSHDGRRLAVKLQYPGIRATIRSDVRLIRGLLRPIPEYEQARPVLDEIEERFLEETDYLREAANADCFGKALNMGQVTLPETDPALTTERVLCMSMLEGEPLNRWLKGDPPQKSRDHAASVLQEFFIRSLYELECIHADPNPGNFLVREDLGLGVVDFGCVKRLDHAFVSLYRQLPMRVARGNRSERLELLEELGVFTPIADSRVEKAVLPLIDRMGEWLGRLFLPEVFDFQANPEFMRQGKRISRDLFRYRRVLRINPDFVFLDRTRYGLLRLFERMGARVSFRNPYEWEG